MTEKNDDEVMEINKHNGIIEVKIWNEIYKTWTVKLIRPLVTNFLKTKFPDSLIVPEIDNIDITIFNKKTNEIIPIEIQKTTVGKNRFQHTEFEKAIRKQLETNIKYSGKCWFFMDSEYLRYLQSAVLTDSGTDIDMTWLIELMKNDILKMFAIKYDGVVTKLTTNDFNYIKLTEDRITLYTNKLKIFRNVTQGYNFTQEEIDTFSLGYNEHLDNNNFKYYCIKNKNVRCKLYGYILQSIGSLNGINNILNMKFSNNNTINKFPSTILGIFEVVGSHKHANLIKFVDKFDICKYFPGYIKNKEQWNSYKGNNLTHETFTSITNGSLKYNKTLMDY